MSGFLEKYIELLETAISVENLEKSATLCNAQIPRGVLDGCWMLSRFFGREQLKY